MKSRKKKILLGLFLMCWGIFCAVFFTIPDSPAHPAISEMLTSKELALDVTYRVLVALGFGALFGGILSLIIFKRKTIELTFSIIALVTYSGMTTLIAWFFSGQNFGNLTFIHLIYSLLLAFPATIAVIELVEVVL